MKKISFILIITLLFSLCACTGAQKQQTKTTSGETPDASGSASAGPTSAVVPSGETASGQTPTSAEDPTVDPPDPGKYSEGLGFTLCEDGQSYYVSGFGSCTDEDLVIPPTHEGKPVTAIGYRALERNANLKSVTLPDSITRIEVLAFQGNTALTTVIWGKGLRVIDNSAFSSCSALTDAILPEGIETVGANVFSSCTSLKNVTFPASVTSVESCLLGCGTMGTITLSSPEAVNSFQGWGNTLNCDLVIDADVDTLREKCFDWCNKVRSITVKSPVTNIETRAFNQCKNSVVITLPATLKTVGDDVFYGCGSLTTVNFGGSEEDWNKIGWNESSDSLKNATVVFDFAG